MGLVCLEIVSERLHMRTDVAFSYVAGAAAVVAGRLIRSEVILRGALLCGLTAGRAVEVENGWEQEGLRLDIERTALVPWRRGNLVAIFRIGDIKTQIRITNAA